MRFARFLGLILLLQALPARAETIDVSDSHGGSVAQYSGRWAELARKGVSVRIVGPCQSACTVLLGHIPRNRICVTPEASFGFHLAHSGVGDRDAAQCLRGRHHGLDQRAWRSHTRVHLDACA